MARPRKPTRLKAVQGTLRPGRESRTAPCPDPGLPPLPQGWAEAAPWREYAALEYREVGPELVELGVLTPIDRAAFLEYCDAWGRKEYWARVVDQEGAVQVTKSGYAAPHPSVGFMNRASADLKRFIALFGLSPSDRSRLVTPERPTVDTNAKFFTKPQLA